MFTVEYMVVSSRCRPEQVDEGPEAPVQSPA
jgi:hypothetical protein